MPKPPNYENLFALMWEKHSNEHRREARAEKQFSCRENILFRITANENFTQQTWYSLSLVGGLICVRAPASVKTSAMYLRGGKNI